MNTVCISSSRPDSKINISQVSYSLAGYPVFMLLVVMFVSKCLCCMSVCVCFMCSPSLFKLLRRAVEREPRDFEDLDPSGPSSWSGGELANISAAWKPNHFSSPACLLVEVSTQAVPCLEREDFPRRKGSPWRYGTVSFIGWSDNHFNNLDFQNSLETQAITTCAAEKSWMFCDMSKSRLLKW